MIENEIYFTAKNQRIQITDVTTAKLGRKKTVGSLAS